MIFLLAIAFIAFNIVSTGGKVPTRGKGSFFGVVGVIFLVLLGLLALGSVATGQDHFGELWSAFGGWLPSFDKFSEFSNSFSDGYNSTRG